MRDEEYVFVSDVRDKKITARSARKQRTHNGKSGRVKFPSDYLTKKELKAMNGEVKSYKLNDPMTWQEFKSMPDDIKEIYIKLIREKFDVPDSAIAEMLGCHRVSLTQEITRLGIGRGKAAGGKRFYDRDRWLAWCNGVPAEKQAEPTESESSEDVHVFTAPERKVEKTIPNHGIMEFNSPAADALDMVKSILGNTNVKITISWEVAGE